jgi:hypothetical protein
MQITTIGLDIAKNVFQVHGIDAEGRRSEATSAQPNTGVLRGAAALPCGYGGLQLTKLGHQVRLMPAKDVALRPARASPKIFFQGNNFAAPGGGWVGTIPDGLVLVCWCGTPTRQPLAACPSMEALLRY